MSRDLLAHAEAVVDASGVADELEARLPTGVRPRQLRVRTLLIGIVLAIADGRPAHLVRVRSALCALSDADQKHLGVQVAWCRGIHRLTYRQVEYTFSRLVDVLAKDTPDGAPSALLSRVVDALVEASVPPAHNVASTSLAIDWSDVETFARPSPDPGGAADKEASFGHRNAQGARKDLFFGYYLSSAVMVADEGAAPVCELVRRIHLASCRIDPVPAFVDRLVAMGSDGIALGDIVADAGYSYRRPEHFALPLRQAGAELVMDLNPKDRGTKGTFAGALCHNGTLYCPATPTALLDTEPLARGATRTEVDAHDATTAELARYKLGRITRPDPDGYHRVMCPAVADKVRCPLRSGSLALSYAHPQITDPPDPAPRCCNSKTVSVPPDVNVKTSQKHDFPSAAHRISFNRRTAVERSYATMKDPASIDVTRGWCRLMGLAAITVLLACAVVARNGRMVDAFDERCRDDERRRALGQEPRTRRRRRRTLTDLVSGPAPP